jgi:hypothetical protein
MPSPRHEGMSFSKKGHNRGDEEEKNQRTRGRDIKNRGTNRTKNTGGGTQTKGHKINNTHRWKQERTERPEDREGTENKRKRRC